jgi:O-antigen/teichoic acid export membrane protein
MKLYGLFLFVRSIIEIVLIVALIFTGWGIFGVVLAMLISYLVTEVIMLILIIRDVGVSFPPLSSFRRIKDYLRFDIPFIPSNLCWWIADASDKYVIAAFLGIAATGIYSAGYNLAGLAILYLGPLNIVLVPALAHLYDNNQMQDVKKHLTYSLKYFLLLGIPSAVGLSLLARPLLLALTTPEFAVAGSFVVPIVAVSMVIHGAQGIITQPISLVKKTHSLGIAWGIAAILNLVLNVLLIPRFGIIAAAITTLLSFTVAAVITCKISFTYLKFDIDWISILKSLFATELMAIIIILVNPTGVINILCAVVIGVITYFVIIYLTKALTRQEIFFFRDMFLNLKSSFWSK